VKPLRVLIADDEPLAREGLRRLVAADGELAVAGEAGDGRRTVEAVRQLAPDLVLLDVQMPELDGFEVIRTVGAEQMPPVIFVTAYEEYALDAFRVAAVDYLVKPFADARFVAAIDRAKRIIRGGDLRDLSTRLQGLLAAVGPGAGSYLTRFVVRTGDRAHVVRTGDVDWIEAADYCAKLHVGGTVHVIRASLAGLERQLDPTHFFRLHRSAIVNLDRIRRIDTERSGEAAVVLADGTRLNLAQGRRGMLEEVLGKPS
jgi:two-component system LytT family response regulator